MAAACSTDRPISTGERNYQENIKGLWVDQEVVVDNNLVSSRKPDDIPAFNREMIELFSRTRHAT